jgi:hypothetical protein
VATELAALEREGKLIGTLGSIGGSYLHMHANRLLRSEQRAQELVLYDFLLRLYESEAARARPRAPKPAKPEKAEKKAAPGVKGESAGEASGRVEPSAENGEEAAS